MKKQTEQSVIIIGAGMAGTLMAMLLAKKGYTIHIFEEREDLRKQTIVSTRSMNLSLTTRGIRILRNLGLWKDVKNMSVLLNGRVIHPEIGSAVFQPYGKNHKEVEFSLVRSDLNALLLTKAEKYKNIYISFNSKCIEIDKRSYKISIQNTITKEVHKNRATFVIGADGLHSSVRKILQKGIKSSCNLYRLSWGYKDLHLSAFKKNNIKLIPHVLHMWPRGKVMLFIWPNRDNSYTCALTLPNKGKESFASLNNNAKVLKLFNKKFPDLSLFFSEMVTEFKKKKVGNFSCLYTSPWFHKDFIILVGDACHAVMPFYSQGVSVAFEDCETLVSLLEEYKDDRKKAFSMFEKIRKKDVDLLIDLSRQRFFDLKDQEHSPFSIARSRLELLLSQLIPTLWIPMYSLIVHTALPYSQAVKRYQRQIRIAKFLGFDCIVFVLGLYIFIKQNIIKQKGCNGKFQF